MSAKKKKREPCLDKHAKKTDPLQILFPSLGAGSDRVKIDRDDLVYRIFCGVEDSFLMTPERQEKV